MVGYEIVNRKKEEERKVLIVGYKIVNEKKRKKERKKER